MQINNDISNKVRRFGAIVDNYRSFRTECFLMQTYHHSFAILQSSSHYPSLQVYCCVKTVDALTLVIWIYVSMNNNILYCYNSTIHLVKLIRICFGVNALSTIVSKTIAQIAI